MCTYTHIYGHAGFELSIVDAQRKSLVVPLGPGRRAVAAAGVPAVSSSARAGTGLGGRGFLGVLLLIEEILHDPMYTILA